MCIDTFESGLASIAIPLQSKSRETIGVLSIEARTVRVSQSRLGELLDPLKRSAGEIERIASTSNSLRRKPLVCVDSRSDASRFGATLRQRLAARSREWLQLPDVVVTILTCLRPLDEIDALMPQHVQWLKRQCKADMFLASGRQVPRHDGVILARSIPLEELRAVTVEYPFVKAGLPSLTWSGSSQA